MFVFDLVGGDEDNTVYQDLTISSIKRQYSFLESLVKASLDLDRDVLSLEVLLALNHHGIACLHNYAGQLRPCGVKVGKHNPPPFYEVPALMAMLIDEVNRKWENTDPIFLATYVLWRLNWIHPFVNGNGRAARAACYFILCLKSGRWLEGSPILPELIRKRRPDYVAALEHATDTYEAGSIDLQPLNYLLAELLDQQDRTARNEAAKQQAPKS